MDVSTHTGKTYSPPFFLFNGHLETIYPHFFRRIKERLFRAERIVTPDNDFLDLYLFTQSSDKAVIISHGLEGNAWRPYVLGMVNACYQAGFDVVTWNFRGCGTELNRQLRFYHSGATEDLQAIVQHVVAKGYREVNLIGFSLGGNLTLKYLGEVRTLHPVIRKAATFSVPVELYTSCLQISKTVNRVYAHRFLRSLKEKVIKKSRVMKELSIEHINSIRTILDFDDAYTAPLHGFASARQYYEECSAIKFLENIRIPTLIINAKNDPFLSPECFPEKRLKNHPYVRFEGSLKGGHVGFVQFNKKGLYWSEERATDFLT